MTAQADSNRSTTIVHYQVLRPTELVTCLYYCLFIYDLFIALCRGYSVIYGLDGTRFQSKQWQEIFLFYKTVNAGSETHRGSRSMGTAVLSRGYGGPDVKLTAHLHPVSKLRMSGALPLLPLYAFTARTRLTLPLPFCLFVNDAVSSSDYTVSKMKKDKLRINWRIMEWSSRDRTWSINAEFASKYWGKTRKYPSRDSGCHGRDSNQVPYGNKSTFFVPVI